MTVSYSRSLATFRYASLVRLLLRWRGSVYKAVWPAVSAFIAIYFLLALTYYLLPTDTLEQILTKKTFIQVCYYVAHTSNAIPVSFVLGFFVNMVISRWQDQFYSLPTPDSVCMLMGTFLRKPAKLGLPPISQWETDRPLLFRRTITRYLNLSCALCFYAISLSLRRHVTTLEELVDCGLMTKDELEIYVKMCHENGYFFIPLVWAITLLTRAHFEGMIGHERHLDAMVTAVVDYWKKLQTLFLYDYINVPLVYNQVVTLVVYVYMASLVLSHQFSNPSSILDELDEALKRTTNTTLLIEKFGNGTEPASNETIASYVEENMKLMADTVNVTPTFPIFALLSLVFYMGWLRVAETNVFPFGEDDDDFEVIPLLERNISAGLWFVDNALGTESDILRLVNQQKLPDIFMTGPKAQGEAPVPSALLAEAIKHEAMGWKRTPADHLTPTAPSPAIVVTPPSEEPLIPDLPCPDALRRRTSRFFFAGSMNRLQEQQEEEQAQTRHMSISQVGPEGETLSQSRGFGSFVGRVGRRISEVFNPAPRSPFRSPSRRSSNTSSHYDDVEGTPKRD